jgi:multidrug resistance efflux pump
MKYTRLIVGLFVVSLGLWILVGEQMSGTSADAVVNARLVTVRSDVAGTLSLPKRTLGSRVAKGEVIASLTDELVDAVRLDELLMEKGLLGAEAARVEAEIEDIAAIREALDVRTVRYRRERLADLRTRLGYASDRLAKLESEGVPDQVALNAAFQQGLTGDDSLPIGRAFAVSAARERVETLEIAVRAAEADVFLGDGYNDSPNAEQRSVELQSDLAMRAARLEELKSRAAALDERIDRERVRVNAFRGGDLKTPVEGLYWEVLEDDGVVVQRGDPILRLVDCGSVMITASVAEGVYNRIEVGQTAMFRLNGDATPYSATVTRKAGSGAATIYRNLAVAPSKQHLERYDVTLITDFPADQHPGCAIGRTGRVFFESRPLDGLRSIFD